MKRLAILAAVLGCSCLLLSAALPQSPSKLCVPIQACAYVYPCGALGVGCLTCDSGNSHHRCNGDEIIPCEEYTIIWDCGRMLVSSCSGTICDGLWTWNNMRCDRLACTN